MKGPLSNGMGDLYVSVDAFCIGLYSTSGLPNLNALAWVLGHDMPMVDQWDGFGLNDLDTHVAVCLFLALA